VGYDILKNEYSTKYKQNGFIFDNNVGNFGSPSELTQVLS